MRVKFDGTLKRTLLAFAIVSLVHVAAAAADQAGASDGNLRLFQQFFTDAAVTNQWWEVQMRVLRGVVPPVQNADGIAIGPVVAISPFKNFEVGGRIFFVDYDLDDPISLGGNLRFDGESGAGDLELFGKYRFDTDPMKFAVGASLSLPTGSEDDGLGTGEVVPSLFVAARRDMEGFEGVTGVAHAGLRFNKDAEILHSQLDGKTSVFIGAGVIVKPWANNDFNWTAEATAESERFEDADTDIRLTAGAQWPLQTHNLLRGAVSAGLSDAAPDFEIILAYAYTF